MDVNPYLLITFIIFILIIALIIVWIDTLKFKPVVPKPIQYSRAGLYMPCLDSRNSNYTSSDPNLYSAQICSTGLTCVIVEGESVGVCRKAIGSSCSSIYECVPDAKVCFDGICATSVTGGLNQVTNPDGSCDNGLIPVEGYCKQSLGLPCTDDESCAEGQCLINDPLFPDEKICGIPLPDAARCEFDDQCATHHCDFSSGLGYCQPLGIATGDYRAACSYYQNESQSTACSLPLNCNYVFGMSSDDIGYCANLVYSWPTNIPEEECSPNGFACIPPSICSGGRCIFPDPNPMSCAKGESSGYCTQGYNCSENYSCIASSGYPDYPGNSWGLVQWHRSTNNSMGYWKKVFTFQQPSDNPCLSTLDTSQGLTALYSPNSTSYTLYTEASSFSLNITYNTPSDWPENVSFTSKKIYFVPETTRTLIGNLIIINNNVRNRLWILVTSIPNTENLTFTFPNYASVNSSTYYDGPVDPITAVDFDLSLKAETASMIVNYQTTVWKGTPYASTNFTAYSFIGTSGFEYGYSKHPQIFANGIYAGITYIDNNRIAVNYSTTETEIVGTPTVYTIATSKNSTSLLDLEILYINYTSTRTYLRYIYGYNDVVLPVNVPLNAYPSISILDTSLSGTSKYPNLNILTSIK